MTKKFWADWQRRRDETKSIWIHDHSSSCFVWRRLIIPDRFILFEFNNDAVNIVYETVRPVLGPNGGHHHSEIQKIRLHRTDIQTVKFKKRNT